MSAGEPNPALLVVTWVRLVQIFQDMENERMIDRDPTEGERQEHRHVLAMLIWQTESLARWFRCKGVTEQAGVSLEAVEATLEGLYDKQRGFYGEMTEGRRAQVLDEVFGVS